MGNTKALQIVYGDGTLGVTGPDCHYIFSYSRGGLESLVVSGKEWLYREPKPTFWRATTDNDRGNGFSRKSLQWLGADMFIDVAKIEVQIDERPITLPVAPINNQYGPEEFADRVQITYFYKTATVPATAVSVQYTVTATGQLRVQASYLGNADLPDLPVFGMRFVIPTLATGYEYAGLSGETYPDRLIGGKPGTYHVTGLPVTPYLVPQDCGMHMQTKWLKVIRNTTKNNADHSQVPFSLKFSQGGAPFAFSALPYTAEELENATHQEELPVPRRTVVSILGAVRSVGGIDSWGADVDPAYHIPADQDILFDFVIEGV